MSQRFPDRTEIARRPGRRNNAPIRQPRRRPTAVPELLLTLAAVTWTMAVAFFAASFVDDDITSGEAGPILARIFAGALTLSGLFLGILGAGLLRDEVRRLDHYLIPLILGSIIGALEVAIFLWPADQLLLAPFVLLAFAFKPVRRWSARVLRLPRTGMA